MKQILLLLTILSLSAGNVFSQAKQANYWYFGAYAGLNYNTGSPPSALSDGNTWVSGAGTGGSASISDDEGNLLFYSDGREIWNKNHNIMQNGSDMGNSSTQGAMIVPYPGNNNLYCSEFLNPSAITLNGFSELFIIIYKSQTGL